MSRNIDRSNHHYLVLAMPPQKLRGKTFILLRAVLVILTVGAFPLPLRGNHKGDPRLAAYYAGTTELTGQELREKLHRTLETGHAVVRYSGSTSGVNDVWAALMAANQDPDDSNNVLLIYSLRSEPKSSFMGNPDGLPEEANKWNREHAWPQSRGLNTSGNTRMDRTDLHALFPADSNVNSSRGNKIFDESDESDGRFTSPAHAEALSASRDIDSWEPPDSVKGDIARALFYMDVRYDGQEEDTTDLELVDFVPTSGTPQMGMLSTLINWHLNDPPDDFEHRRNDLIADLQGNRNPFVDHPQLVQDIFIVPEPSMLWLMLVGMSYGAQRRR